MTYEHAALIVELIGPVTILICLWQWSRSWRRQPHRPWCVVRVDVKSASEEEFPRVPTEDGANAVAYLFQADAPWYIRYEARLK